MSSNTLQFSRRAFLQTGMSSGLALAAGMPTIANASTPLRIGFIPERDLSTGLAGSDTQFIVDETRNALANGIEIGGTVYAVDIITVAEGANIDSTVGIAQSLIDQGVNLMLCSSESRALITVATTCETAGVPCLTLGPPWEVWFFGRGGKPGQPSPFKWTAHIGASIDGAAVVSARSFDTMNSNKKIGVVMEDGPEANTIEKILTGSYAKVGYEIIPFQRYAKGTTDWSAQMDALASSDADVLMIVMENSDFLQFVPQLKAHALSAQLKVVQVAKTGSFPDDIKGLGLSAHGLTVLTEWTKGFPYSSSTTGINSLSLAFAYEDAFDNQWTSRLGSTQALFDAAVSALKNAAGIDADSIAASLYGLKADTIMGEIDFTSGPIPGVGIMKMVPAQWVEALGGYYPFDLMVLDNTDHPTLQLEWDMKSFNAV